MLKSVASFALFMALSSVVAVVIVVSLDPACGADGTSQLACAAEIVRDLTP